MFHNGVPGNGIPALRPVSEVEPDDSTGSEMENPASSGVGDRPGTAAPPSADGKAAMPGGAAGLPPRPARPPLFPDRIPAELKGHRRWLVWRYELRGQPGKWTKPPFNAVTGHAADTTDPTSWGTFEDALAAYERGGWDGIGFALGPGNGDPADFVALDLDKCIDPQTEQFQAWAAEVVETLNTYAELSPSGRGIRLIARGEKPGPKCRKGGFEMYDRDRYVTLTGCRLDSAPATVEPRQGALDAVYSKLLGGPGPRPKPRQMTKPAGTATGDTCLNAEDLTLLEKARAAANGEKFGRLWDGDWQGQYPSQSEADLALCGMLAFWTDQDADRVDRLFRHSGLYRPKWDELRGDQSYGEKTVAMAVEGQGRSPTSGGTPEPDREHLTDAGNAKRLVGRHGDGVRYCHPWKKWLVWDGCRWRPDDTGWVVRLAKETMRELIREASAARAAVAKELGD
jgi:putative DNA primase/helicase